MNNVSIRVDNLSVGYKTKSSYIEVISNLNFEVESGTLLCLIGKNGAGKSTLLRTLANLQEPLQGKIELEGRNLNKLTSSEKATTFAIVLTDSVIDSGLTVYEIITLSRIPYLSFGKKTSETDLFIIRNALEEVKLWNKKEKKLTQLSDGEKQRVMIAKALAQETKIIFLDEPTSHLDLVNRHEIMQLLHRLCREKHRTIILSTHEIELSLQIADRILILNNETDCVQGVPEDLVLKGKLQSVFNHKSVQFDPNIGQFRMKHKALQSVSLISRGEGIMTFWTRQALLRNNYYISANACVLITVDERRRSWTLDCCNSTDELFSLEQLLISLSKCKI